MLDNCLDYARKLASQAKSGSLKVDGEVYSLTFDPSQWLYIVRDSSGTFVTNFNTKSLQHARKWLREWLAN